MNWNILTWLLAFIVIAALFGRALYCMIQFEDLGQDLINPFDLAKRVNSTAMIEYIAAVLVAVLLLFNGFWVTAAAELAVSVLLTQQFMKGELYIDATDAFKKLPQLKWRKGVVFAMHALCFLLSSFRLIECVVLYFSRVNEKKLRAINALRKEINSHHIN